MTNDIPEGPDDHVAFRAVDWVSNDLQVLAAALRIGATVTWYSRAQMAFMAAACGPKWERFSKGPAIRFERRPRTEPALKSTDSSAEPPPKPTEASAMPSRLPSLNELRRSWNRARKDHRREKARLAALAYWPSRYESSPLVTQASPIPADTLPQRDPSISAAFAVRGAPAMAPRTAVRS